MKENFDKALPTPYQLYIEYETLNTVIDNISLAIKSPILANALVGIENTAAILELFYSDTRNTVNKLYSFKRISECLIKQFELLSDIFEIDEFNCPTIETYSKITVPSKLGFLFDLTDNFSEKLREQYLINVKHYQFYFGFESAITLDYKKPQKTIINYNLMEPILDLYIKNLTHDESPEDYFFCVIHQITECWLNIFYIYTNKANNLLLNEDYRNYNYILCLMNSIIDFATLNIELLELMVHKDYHPLRIKLRDASGAQSFTAKNLRQTVMGLAKNFKLKIESQGINLSTILKNCDQKAEKYICFSSLLRLIKNCRSFFLNHFLLASNTIGQQTIGSLGYEVNQLAQHFLQPLAPEFEQALYDFTILTNFQYSETSGKTIMDKEVKINPDIYNFHIETPLLYKPRLKAKAIAYFNALQNKEIDSWLSLFNPKDCHFKEHNTSKPYVGIKQIRVFFKTFVSTISNMHYKFITEEYNDNSITIQWHINITMYNQKPLEFTGYEKISFNEDYLIVSVESGWDSNYVSKQLVTNLEIADLLPADAR